MLKRLFPPYLFAADQGTPTGTATTAAAAASPEPKTQEPKPEEGKPKDGDMSGVRAFVSAFLTDDEPPKSAPNTELAKPEDGAKPKETAPAATTPPAKTKPKAKPAPQVTSLTPEQIAAAAAEGTARAMAQRQQQAAEKPKPTAAAPEFDDTTLPESARERLPILERMEKLYPEKYKGISDRFRKSTKALQDYAAQWEAANPGKTFNEAETDEDDNPIHQEFFDKNDVPWEDDHYVKALAELETDRRVEKMLKPTQEKLEALERDKKLREDQPKIAQEMLGAARKLWEDLGIPDVLDEKGNVNQAKLAELQKSDSWSFNLRNALWNQIDAETSTLYSILNQLVDYNPKDPTHVALNDFVAARENELLKAPLTEQLDAQGRPFLSMDKFYALPQAERAKHWTFSVKDLAALRASELAANAKKLIDQREADFRAWAESRGIKVDGNPPSQPQGQPAKPAPEPTGAGTKPSTPSIDAETGLAASQRKVAEGSGDARSAFFSKFLE